MRYQMLGRIGKYLLFCLLLLVSLFFYTFLHEGGHALVSLLSGSTVTAFNINFLDLSARVETSGTLTPLQAVLNNLAGLALPLILWIVFLLVVPKRANPVIESVKVLFSIVAIDTLLAWIVLPLLSMAGITAFDDSINFAAHSGIPPVWVSLAAFALFVAGWVFFFRRIEGIREELTILRELVEGPLTPAMQKSLLGVAAAAALAGFFSLGVNGFRLAPEPTAYQPPEGYRQVANIDLSESDFTQEPIYILRVDSPVNLGIILLVEDIRSDFIDMRLTGPGSYDLTLLHGEGYSMNRDVPMLEVLLPPGEYRFLLTSTASSGTLTLFLRP